MRGRAATISARISSVTFMTSKSAETAAVTGLAAARAADGLEDLDVVALGQPDVLAGHARRSPAGVAHPPREALRDHAVDRRRDEVGLDAHVDEPHRRARRVVGVQRGEHEVAGERGVDRDVGALAVADLADHDDVGVGAHDGAQTGGEGQSGCARRPGSG